MKAIILAAGLGIKASDEIPKALLPLGKTTIIHRQVSILRWCGISDITIVIGSEGKCWNRKTHEMIEKLGTDIITNPHNLSTRSNYSLYLALDNVEQCPILAIDGDLVFNKENIEALVGSEYKTVLISRPALSISEAGGKIALEGNRVIAAGNIKAQQFPWNIYAGIIKIGNDTYKAVKETLPKRRKQHIFNLLSTLCKKYNIYNINLDAVRNEEKPSFLVGGSYAKLKRSVVVRKEARSKGVQKLINEIKWLETLPPDLQPYFPQLQNYHIASNYAWFETPYYDIPSLRRLLFIGEIDAPKAMEILENVLAFMFSRVYTKNKIKGDPTWVYKLHIQRIERRLMATKQETSIFKDIIEALEITLNGRKYENIHSLVAKIKTRPGLIKALAPTTISMIHGDLHFQNILVDLANKNRFNFILADPRGELSGSDPTYDLGKLWHSVHGLYDFIHEDLIKLEIDSDKSKVEAHLEFEDMPALSEYKKIYRELPRMAEKYSTLANMSNWEMRTLFAEAAHFCSVMPFHLKNDGVEKRAIALYLTGVKLINEFTQRYSLEKWKEELPWINVNTPKDYLHATRYYNE